MISIAPMMDWTDRHYRYFVRQISRHSLLYTEMVTTGAILFGNKPRHLDFSREELPLVLQLGGDDPKALAECARVAEQWGYSGLNLNVGCPSERVQNGNFGVCLMTAPEVVARAVEAMQQATVLPVSVKHRIGVDDLDRYEDMANFVKIVSETGVKHFIVHARKAWLKGLSPKENRTIPPLRYAEVYKLKQEFPHLHIEINGGITTLDQAREHLKHVDGVMIGRAAYDNPYLFAFVDQQFFNAQTPVPTRREILEKMLPYIDHWTKKDVYLKHLTRHMLGLFSGRPGARAWKHYLSKHAHRPEAGTHTVMAAMQQVPDSVLDERLYDCDLSLTPV
jgi:tRNA-dihydrouridine synthase A